MTEERDGTLGEVIDQRVQVYGNPVETFARIAEVWSGILGHTVNATDVPLCLIGMKIVRTTQAPDYSDNSDDIEGYLDIFRQLVGPDMIQARSVTEYIEKKWGPKPPPCTCQSHGIGQPRWHKDCPEHGDMPIPSYGVAQANADQSEFYAENDRTKDAGPDEDEDVRGCSCGMADYGAPGHDGDKPIPFTLANPEVAKSRVMLEDDQCTCPAPMEGGSHYGDCGVHRPTVYTHKSGLANGQDRVCFWMAKDKEWVFQYPGTGELTSCDLEHQ